MFTLGNKYTFNAKCVFTVGDKCERHTIHLW